MTKHVLFFLTVFSFSLGLTAGAVAMRPIEEPASDGATALDELGSSDATVESEAEVPVSAVDPESTGGERATGLASEATSSEDDFTDTGRAQIPGSTWDDLPSATTEAAASGAAQRLARVFARMNPRAAAPILSNLSDAEIQLILMDVPDRTVAEILSSMEPERAARLTRLLIRTGEVGSE